MDSGLPTRFLLLTMVHNLDEETARRCKQVQEQHIEQLESEAQKQLDQTKHGGNALIASMTVRQVLEIERNEQSAK
ncbi:hypothetical protein HG536_0C06340 [Torulaspora globosa]|uniref:Uncharacterized protein n=1 Tax=Torulaspora globosa TaxID=48254 RepID=A0A7G3ZG29_9SACH|nr:uncharacterized protein HG536_0C06340 [Torulaspora globosa]QLL32465.1 hypothetical protein HG536_0C06340 [Torulaspora globosa]